jgi:pimeloyl-ACP methyl ester carboxylesterase
VHSLSRPTINVERFDASEPAFLLIHGLGEGGYIWDLFAPILARRFTTLVVDLRGHGNSGWDPLGRYDLYSYAADLIEVIDHSAIDDLVLVGHSLGGQIALCLGTHLQRHVRASVLVDSAPELNATACAHARGLLKESLRNYATIDDYACWLKRTRPLASACMLEHIAATSLRLGRDGFRHKLDPTVVDEMNARPGEETQMLWKLLSLQTWPTLIVRGQASALLSSTTARRARAMLPQGDLIDVAGAGHTVMCDNPEGFERHVMVFLEKALAPSTTPSRRQMPSHPEPG